ncbi:MAG TPA: hypothetical protein VJZ26_17050 [Blastocatellia bacterium]|nr:hypothetical protein [Blastocatellia bacterium]
MSEKDNQTRQQIIAAIKSISDDNESGAAEILGRAAGVFSLAADRQTSMNSSGPESARAVIVEICARLALAQPDMAPLANLASEVNSTVSRIAEGAEVRDVFELAAEAARSFTQSALRSARFAASHAASLIADGVTVLTHSRSSTVIAALLEARGAGKNFTVIATESRPALEGRNLAEAVAREGARVILVADAAAALLMEQVDFVLMGADRVTPEFLINKIGTRMIALAAREQGVPVYALCDTSKFTSASSLPDSEGESRSADELWAGAPEGVLVLNRYFEPTPLGYFTGIITENGALDPDHASRSARAKPSSESPPGPLRESE